MNKKEKNNVDSNNSYARKIRKVYMQMTIDELAIKKESFSPDVYNPEAVEVIKDVFEERKDELKSFNKEKETSSDEIENSEIIKDKYTLEIEGERVDIIRLDEGIVEIYKQDEKIFEISKKESRSINKIEINGHILEVQYKKYPTLISLLFWLSGFRLYLDKKPLKGTLSDTKMKIKIAHFALYLFSAINFFAFIIISIESTILNGIAFLMLSFVLLILGVLTKRFPIFCTAIGSLYGVFETTAFVINSMTSDYFIESFAFFLFWFLLRGGATLALIQGFISAVRLKK